MTYMCKQTLQVLAEIHMYCHQNMDDLLSINSVDVFTVTCGRSGVGSITSVDLRIDGSNRWRLEWIDVSDGLETARFEVNDWLDDYETRHLQRG